MKILKVIEKATGEVVETIDVTGESETAVAQIRNGLRTQMNHQDYRLVEEES